MYKSKVRFSYLISHFMHFLETIGLGSRTSRKYTRKVHATAPGHKSYFLPINYAISDPFPFGIFTGSSWYRDPGLTGRLFISNIDIFNYSITGNMTTRNGN